MASIYLKENEQPILTRPTMLCDGGLHEKLNRYDVCKFMNRHSNNLLIGASGSGKTSLLYSLFRSPKCLRKVFHTVYLFQPTASGDSIENNIFAVIPEDQRYDEMTEEGLDEVLDNIRNEDRKYNSAIIIDDMTAYLKDSGVQRKLKEIIFNRRHYRTSIFFLVQSYVALPLQIRKSFNNLFIFKVSKIELATIFDELVERRRSLMEDLAKLVFDVPHRYLFINTDTQRLFRGFDELVVVEE